MLYTVLLLGLLALSQVQPGRSWRYAKPPAPPPGRGRSPGGPPSRRPPGPPVGPPSPPTSGGLPHGIETDNSAPPRNRPAPPPGVAVQPMPMGGNAPGSNRNNRPAQPDTSSSGGRDSQVTQREEPECEDYAPVPNNCTQFYRCVHTTQVVFNCPDGLHFNRETKTCTWPAEARCVRDPPPTPDVNMDEDEDCKTEAKITTITSEGRVLIVVCAPGFGYVADTFKIGSQGKATYNFGSRPLPKDTVRRMIADAEEKTSKGKGRSLP